MAALSWLSYLERLDEPKTMKEIQADLDALKITDDVKEKLFEAEKSKIVTVKRLSASLGDGVATTLYRFAGEEELKLDGTGLPMPLPGLQSLSTPTRKSAKVHRPFRSPRTSPMVASGSAPARTSVKNIDGESLRSSVASLREELGQLQEEIDYLSRLYSEEELQHHIDALHEYNEIKDVGQVLLGKMAEIQRTTTTQLYDQFGLSLTDD